VKDSVGGEDKDAAPPIFGKRRSDVARDRSKLLEQLDGLCSAVDSDSLYSIVGSCPDNASRVLEQAANTLLVKACLLTDVDCGARSLTDDSPVVRTDPEVTAATYQQ
jgi:hypothetical protein